jgi:hypothetical protein
MGEKNALREAVNEGITQRLRQPGGNAMGETELQILEDTEQQLIELWRTEELERAGYSHRAAGRLAARQDVDLHQAVQLLARGCSPELALKILL